MRAREGRDVVPDALRERGAEVDVLALYETVPEPIDPATVADVDWITFTSASTVRFLAQAAGALPGAPRLASIGPATSAALREHGREPDLEADPHTPDGLVDALVAAADHYGPSVTVRPNPARRRRWQTQDEGVALPHEVRGRSAVIGDRQSGGVCGRTTSVAA